MDINLVHLHITVTTSDVNTLCVALRKCGAAINKHFKALACRYPAVLSCHSCPDRQLCAYTHVFSQDLSHDPSAVVRYQKPPLPFVISFPGLNPDCRTVNKDVICHLVLLGTAITYISMMIESISRVLNDISTFGRCGYTQLVSIQCLDYNQSPQPMINTGGRLDVSELLLLDGNVIAEQQFEVGNKIAITFVMPLMLMDQGKIMRYFDVGKFLRTLLRRVSALLYYYCGIELQQDFKYLSRLISGIELSDSSFRWQENGNGISGICGTGILRGNVHPLSFFLRLGELFHLGKGASYGMGQFFIK